MIIIRSTGGDIMKKYPILWAVAALILAALACSLPIPDLKGSSKTPTRTDLIPAIALTEQALRTRMPTSQTGQPAASQPTVKPASPTATQAAAKPSVQPTPAAANSTRFPMPPGGSILTSTDVMAVFQVKMSLKDAVTWYRDSLGKQGLKERTALTGITDSTFMMVFDGAADGLSMIVQGTAGGGSLTITILYEKM
jgi:hypothetical protein